MLLRLTTVALLFCMSCKIQKRPEGVATDDDFERADIGENWLATGAGYRIEKGELVVSKAYNHPLWLKRPLPANASIDIDAWSNDDAGDIKVEAWGDGKSYAQSVSYTATSYVFVFGGWSNRVSVIARMDEHGNDRRAREDVKVEKGKKYHFHIERKNGQVAWTIDGKPFLQMDDKAPLDGPDHAYFAINDWETELHFDNLKIKPLP